MSNKTTVSIDDKQYKLSDMTEKQQRLVAHLHDVSQKINKANFELEQLNFTKSAFINELRLDLESNDETKETD